MTHASQPPTVGTSATTSATTSSATTAAAEAATTEEDAEVVLTLDLGGLVSLLTRSAMPLRTDRPGDPRPTYLATWRVAEGSDPSAAWTDDIAAGRPVGVRSTVDRVTGGVWAPGATVDGAVANVERGDGHLQVVIRPPRPVGERPPPVVHLPVDLTRLVVAVEVAPEQPDWLRQAVAGAIQAGHHHALPAPGVR